jgi:aspartate 1-decarboxylase
MRRRLLKSKIHRATVVMGDLNYEGSLTLGYALMKAADLVPYEYVHVTNLNNGAHWVTYALADPDDPEMVCMNGTAARHFVPGDPVIVLAYTDVDDAEAANHHPHTVHVNDHNQVVRID